MRSSSSENPECAAGGERPARVSALHRIYLVCVYWTSWAGFLGVGACFGTGVCLPLLVFRRAQSVRYFTRRSIAFLMNVWVRWLHFTGVARVQFEGFDPAPLPGAVYVANHPSLLDATFLLAQIPHAICIFKPSLLRNPVTGPSAVLAGYLSAADGLDLFKDVQNRLAEGCSVLIFPEGRRTQTGAVLNPVRPGFAVIACRAHAPVQAVVIRTSRGLGRRGGVWWQPPEELPARIVLSLDRRWEHCPDKPPSALAAEVEAHFQSRLSDLPV
jgi:1-acyl-sn-glycerol-3-phosphate acyltransferase